MTYDEKQTQACNNVRNALLTIISQATEALDHIGSDKATDLLHEIFHERAAAVAWNNRIVNDDFS